MTKALTTFLVVLALSFTSTPATSGVLHPGHSGHWYVPERSGEGWVLEILAEDRALLYWFTYDESGNQRWLIGDGEILKDSDGWALRFSEMLVTQGPRFGADFDSDSLVYNVAGAGLLRFSDCNNGVFEFQGYGQDLAFPIQRLTRTMGPDCNGPLHGHPDQPIQPYAGQSGSWYDPATAGQGFVLQWAANGGAVVTWFTYDPDGNQQWMVGTGTRQGERLVFPEVYSARGGSFGSEFDSEDVQLTAWGRLEFELGCDAGSMEYESWLPKFSDGGYSLERLTSLMRLEDCPAVTPVLAELYELEYRELPVIDGAEQPTEALSIAGDGSVLGTKNGPFGNTKIHRILRPEGSQWIDIEGAAFSPVALLSNDGNTASFNVLDGGTESGADRFVTKIWRDGMGASPLPGQNLGSSFVRGASSNASCLVGNGSIEPDGPYRSWIWISGGEQVLLPEATGLDEPVACSDDGRIVVGNEAIGATGLRELPAIRWLDGATPAYLFDSEGARLRFAQACSSDCSIIVGGDQVELDPKHPHFREPWLWSENTGARYLGMPEDAFIGFALAPVVAWDVSQDGSFVVGEYGARNEFGEWIGSRAFIWTERTGQVLLSQALAEAALSDGNWLEVGAISVADADGIIRVLLEGEYLDPPPLAPWVYPRRAAILSLIPRNIDWFE